MLLRRPLFASALMAAIAVNACSSTEQAPPLKGPRWPLLACDPLVPEVCGFPYPNNVFTVPDATSPSGRRLSLSAKLVPTGEGKSADPAPFNRSDGFSASTAIYAYLPGASPAGMPTPQNISASQKATSPTLLIDAASGALIPHYAGLDRSGDDASQRAIIIQPAVRLADNTRYIAVLQGVVGSDGKPLPASEVFAQIRDRITDQDASVAPRLALYDDIFQTLTAAGVSLAGVQLAWDFTTASSANNTTWLVHMRDDALARVGAAGPPFSIDSVDTDFRPEDIAYRIKGHMEVPLYLDADAPGASLLFAADGLPTVNADTPTQQVPFEVLIPQRATTQPAALLQYGHGLLGRHTQIESGHFASFMNEYNYAMFAVDLSGMASDDEGWVAGALVGGELHQLTHMFDRMHQGVLNNLLAMRMMITGFAADPTYGGFIDPTRRYYHGISQGGIFGGVYMGLTTDVQRGALGVMGQSYNLLLNRSVDFDPFFTLLGVAYPDYRDQQLALALLQLGWDRVEPSGYTHHIATDPLPGGAADKQLLLRAAIGDHQVSTLAAHVMARSLGATHVDTGLRKVWGLNDADSSHTGAGYVEYDFGLPPEPLCNVPMRQCEDPHGKLRKLPAARQQLDHFLRTGEVKSFCQGACSFPELSGCDTTPPTTEDPCATP